MVLLDTGTPGTSREMFSEDADDLTRTLAKRGQNILHLQVCISVRKS